MMFHLSYQPYDLATDTLHSNRIVEVSWNGPEPHLEERMVIDNYSYIVKEVTYHHITIDNKKNKVSVSPRIMIVLDPEHP